MKDSRFQILSRLIFGKMIGSVFAPLLLVGSLAAQPLPFCGTYVKPPATLDGSESGIYLFDRFGNKYDVSEVAMPPSGSSLQNLNCGATGYFNLNYIGNFPADEQATICAVFGYIASLVSNTTGGTVNINIVKEPFADNNVLATGSALYEDGPCGVEHNLVWNKLSTGYNPAVASADGLMRINANYTAQQWHTLAEGNDAPLGTFDLYTVALHEALHIMGFASRITATGAGTNGFYSVWDTYLYSQTDAAHLTIGAANPLNCCDERVFNGTVFNNMPGDVISSCDGDPVITFGINNIAEVNADYPGLPDDNLVRNTLSHLCNAAFVMNAFLGDGEEKRTISAAELQILCQLGYAAQDCDAACIVQANHDNFSTGVNQIDILFSALTANDEFPNGGTIGLVLPCGSSGNVQISNQTATGFTVSNLPVGLTRLCYEITGCNGQCDQASIFIFVVGGNTACDVPNSCELVQHGSFEDIDADGFEQFRFFSIQNSPNNSPDFYTDCNFDPHYGNPNFFCNIAPLNGDVCHNPAMPGDNFVHIGSISYNLEGFYLPLCRSLEPGCNYELSFWMLTGCSNNLNIAFSNEIPCPINTGPPLAGVLLNGLPSVVCNTVPAYTFAAPLILEQPFTDTDLVNDGNPEWIRVSRVFTANQALDIVTFYQDPMDFNGYARSLYLDDISIRDICQGDFTMESEVLNNCIGGNAVIEYTICSNQSVTISLNAVLPQIPGVQFSSQGDFPNGSAIVMIDPVVSQCVTLQLVLDVDLTALPGTTFNVTMNGEIGGGCAGVDHTDVQAVTLSGDNQPPVAGFTFDVSQCPEVAFSSLDQTPGPQHFWDFGDGSTSTEVNPTHQYQVVTGTFTVEHCVTNDCGTVCVTEIVMIDCPPEFACPCTGPNDLNIDAGDPSTNPNDPSVVLVSVSATAIPSSTVNTFFSPNTLARPCIAIKGNLIIDNNYDLFILGGEIRMQPGAKIIVAPGATLRLGFINGGTGTEQGIHGCDQMWRSIEVRPGGSLYSGYNVIQDAEYAFDLRSGAGTTTTLTSYWNDFNRNHVGVRVNNTSTATISQPFQFAKNQFRATSALVPKFSDDITNWNATAPYTGLSLANTTFFVGTQGDPGSDNEFNGLRNGILADRATLNVYYARFLNTQGVLDHSTSNPNFTNSQGIGIFARSCGTFNVRNCTFNGAPRAIHTQQSSLDIRNSLIQNVDAAIYNVPALFNRINVYDNDIFFRGRGVVVNGASTFTRVFIDRNDPIQAVPSSIFLPYAIELINMPATSSQTKRVANNRISLQVPNARGIHIGSAGGWKVQNNYVEYTNPSIYIDGGITLDNADNNYLKENEIRSTTPASSNGKAGINLYNSENNTLCCNITDDLYTGLHFIGVNDDTKLRHSDIRDHVFGLHCGYPVAPGQPLPTAIIGDQVLAGNAWNGSYAFLGAVHNGDVPSIFGSQFLSELPPVLPLWPDNPLSPAAADQWFLPTGGNSSTCIADASNCPVLPPPPDAPEDPRDLTDNEKAIASGQYGGPGAYGLAAQFEGERSLYGKMKRNASLSGQDALVDQFFGGAHTSVIGRLYEIDSLTTDLGRMSEADWQQLNQLDNSIDSISEEINRIDSLYAFASTASDSLALQNQKKSLTNYLQSLQQAWQSLSDSLYQVQLARVPSVAALNTGIISNDLLVNNRKVVNRIFLETLALGNYTATETQLNDLLAVASQCFLEGGDAVLQARALYSAFAQPLQIDDIAICGYQGEERSTKGTGMGASGNYEIKVMPNPAKNRISFLLPGASPDATFFVQIFDLNGKIVKELNVRNGEVLAETFLPGLYFCRVDMGEEPAQTVKFIIIP